MKKHKVMKASSLALASTLLIGALPFQGVASAATVSKAATHLKNLGGLQHVKVTNPASAALKGYISPKIDTKSSKQVRVIVQLTGQPIAVGKYAAKMGNNAFTAEANSAAIAKQQTSFIAATKAQGLAMKVNYQFNTVLNGMEISIPANQIPKLAKVAGVSSVFENKTYYSIPDEKPTGLDSDDPKYDIEPLKQIGVDQAWAKGITGKGLKVGVIDTGVDYYHPDLKNAFKGGHDSFFGDNDPYEEQPVGEDFEGTQHGTHVSGTIAGRAQNTGSDIVQKGVAYDANLYVYKVLGYTPETGTASGSSAQVIDGIERAVKDGMDVINLSLGSDSEKDPNSPDSIAINNAVLAGVTAVIANGNAADKVPGQYYYSMGSPASSQLAISVGAATSPSNHYTATTTSSFDDTLSYDLNVMGWGTGHEDFANILGTAPVNAVYVGLGKPADYTGKDVKGKVVLVSRGELAFVDKIKNAKAHGAKAIIIFNGINQVVNGVSVPNLSASIPGRDGNIGGTGYVGDSFDFIPAFDMSGAAGRALATQVLANPTQTLSFTFGADFPKTVDTGDNMTSFSSRGPNSDGNYSIKPDISAPGYNILSTWPAYGKYDRTASYAQAYNRISGTSMATPHVAGLSLLLKQAHPNWTPFDIRAALANTADEINDPTGVKYDVYSQGAGRVNVANALNTPALLETVESLTILDKNLKPQTVTDYGDNASFGLMHAGDKAKSEMLQVKNFSKQSVKYNASINMHSSVTTDPYNPIATPDSSKIVSKLLGLAADNSITVAANGTKNFFLNVAPTADAPDGVYEGEVDLASAGLPTLHIPFVVNVGQEPTNNFGLENLKLSNPLITLGEQGKDTTDLTVTSTDPAMNYMEVDVYGLNDKLLGTMAVDATPDTVANDGSLVPIAPGTVSFQGLDNSYVAYDDNGNPYVDHLKDGTYKLQVVAADLDKNGNVVPGTMVYDATTTFGVSSGKDATLIANAADTFATDVKVANTTQKGQDVLALPSIPGVTYKVTDSSNPNLISKDGKLLALPTTAATDVTLTVNIAAADNSTINLDTTTTVHLNVGSLQPYLLQNGKLTKVSTSMLKASVDVNVNKDVFKWTASPYVIFQLMKGNTPVTFVATSLEPETSATASAYFNATGTGYSVKVYVVDSVDAYLLKTAENLADPITLQ